MATTRESKAARAGTAALTVTAAAATLLYLFLLLVPHWRLVQVDRPLLQRRLAESGNASAAAAWRWFLHGVQLRSRSANLFRECLWQEADGVSHLRLPEAANGTVRTDPDVLDVANDTVGVVAGEECWLLDLRWAEGLGDLASEQRSLLHCLRALFLLAVLLLCCHFVAMVTSLYACFASALGRGCALALLVTQCAVLCLSVTIVVLQDFTRELLLHRLRRRVEEIFPSGCGSAIAASTGACCLVLLCLLVGVAALQLLLLLFVSRSAELLRRGGDKRPEGETPEGDEDSNPLIM